MRNVQEQEAGLSAFLRGAKKIRHLPILRNQEFLWRLLRKPFHKVLSLNGGTVAIKISGISVIELPPEFTSLDLSNYEKESVAYVKEWVVGKKNALFVDVGSSIGVFSAVALSENNSINVIAIDSDIESLAAVERLCWKHKSRLTTVCGLISDSGKQVTLRDAARLTLEKKHDAHAKGGVHSTKYICIDGNLDKSISFYTLDDLLRDMVFTDILIKIDVEGAEGKVLAGAERFIEVRNPEILLSVHPDTLPDYGSDTAVIARWLTNHTYSYDVIAVDHEEHWVCGPCRSPLLPTDQ